MFLCGDRELLSAFRRGEAEALGRVYRHYFPIIAALVSKGFSFESGGQRLRYRGAGASPDAFDLVHDIFAALFEDGARQAYSGTAPYEAYATTTARNRIISRLRRDKARFVELDEEKIVDIAGGGHAADGGASPEQQVIRRQLEHVVRRFLEEQSSVSRAVARCRFAEDLSQDETAKALGLSRKQVRRLETALRQGLLKRLGGTADRRLLGLDLLMVLA
jgi:RNA polymerase sigma-70 factor (ECF subfamily)